jgi:hypothetical protein
MPVVVFWSHFSGSQILTNDRLEGMKKVILDSPGVVLMKLIFKKTALQEWQGCRKYSYRALLI